MSLILAFVLLVLSVGGSGLIYYFCHLYSIWYYFFIPILLIPILFVFIFGVYLILVFMVTLFMNKKKPVDEPKRFWYFWVQQTAFILLLLSRTSIKKEGLEQLDKKKRYLVISNHLSNFDPMVMMTRLKLNPLICVTKKENMKIPICGPFIHHAGFISLDRSDSHSAVYMVKKATEFLTENKSHIYICPEGTRSKTGELLPFHPGSFKIAKRANVEIAVCYIENTNQIAKHFPWKRTKSKIRLLRIISKEEVEQKSTLELAELTYSLMKNYKENKQ